MSQAPHNPSAPPADTNAASVPAPSSTPPAPAAKDDVDLANMVDDLLAQIDDAGQTLANDVAAEVASHEAAATSVAPSETPTLPSEAIAAAAEISVSPVANTTADIHTDDAIPALETIATQPSPVVAEATPIEPPTATPPAAEPVSHEDLLAQVDSLIQQVQTTQPSPSPLEAAPTPPPPPPAAAAIIAETPAPIVAPPSAVTATAPTPVALAPQSAPAAQSTASLAALDEEVSKIAGKMLDQTPADVELSAPAPASQANVPARQTTSAAPSQPDAISDAALEAPAPKPRLRIRVPSVAPIIAKLLAPLSAPLAGKPAVVRQSLGWIACGTIFFSAVLWAVVLTRTPETVTHEPGAFDFQEGNPPAIPVAHAEGEQGEGGHGAAPGGHGEAATEKSESGSGHGDAKKSDAHGSSKSKAPPKKAPPRKNKAAAKAKPEADSGGHH